jgi:benzoyl-CoA-dihydrodiol lyase
MAKAADTAVSFDTKPYDWTHWKLDLDGDVATLAMNIQEDGGMRPGYELKLNSYDLGVDIELYDVLTRLGFEHPEVKSVVVTSALDRVFCSGANIYMLASSSHPFKVNFCKYTNETRCSMEEPEMPTFIAALNGPCAGGGYELAMACDEIYLIDDGSSAVSLPEVPLLGVLPGTGGLTRLVDKRKVRRDLADVFCTKAEGFKARDAVRGRFVDGAFARSKWSDKIREVARKAADAYTGPSADQGITWAKLGAPEFVTLDIDPADRTATLTIQAPTDAPPADGAALTALGVQAWSLKAFRELEHALFQLRFNHLDVGTLLVKTSGDAASVLAWDHALLDLVEQGHWLAVRTLAFQRRTLRRFDNMARSIFAPRAQPGRRPQLHVPRRRGRQHDVAGPHERRPPGHAQRHDAPGQPLLRRAREGRRAARAGRARGRRGGRGDRPGDHVAGRHRLGGRRAHRHRGARQPLPRRPHRHGAEPALLRRRGHGQPHLRAPQRLAELDLPAPQCRRRDGRPDAVRAA